MLCVHPIAGTRAIPARQGKGKEKGGDSSPPAHRFGKESRSAPSKKQNPFFAEALWLLSKQFVL